MLAVILLLFLPPDGPVNGTATFQVADKVGASMPRLIRLAAIGSETSAIIGATSSRSDMLVTAKVPRKISFLVILIPAMLVVIFVDVGAAVNLASRVFAAYYLVETLLAGLLRAPQTELVGRSGLCGHRPHHGHDHDLRPAARLYL
jgi:hypothetical protein